MRSTSVLIAGGGVSGLTTACDLERHGVDAVVVERAHRLGGLISTDADAPSGFVMDAGPDAFLTQKPQAIELCQELGLGDEMIPTNPDRQKVYVVHDGRLHALPAGMRLTVPTRVASASLVEPVHMARQASHAARTLDTAAFERE